MIDDNGDVKDTCIGDVVDCRSRGKGDNDHENDAFNVGGDDDSVNDNAFYLLGRRTCTIRMQVYGHITSYRRLCLELGNWSFERCRLLSVLHHTDLQKLQIHKTTFLKIDCKEGQTDQGDH